MAGLATYPPFMMAAHRAYEQLKKKKNILKSAQVNITQNAQWGIPFAMRFLWRQLEAKDEVLFVFSCWYEKYLAHFFFAN